jgi:hypothetical protein
MSKSVRDKTRPVRPILPARRPSCLSKFVPPRLPQLPPPPRLAPQPRLSAAGEGASTVITHTPQPFFEEICRNPEISSEPVQNQCVATSLKAPSAKPPNQAPCLTRRQESRAASICWGKSANRHKRPPESRGIGRNRWRPVRVTPSRDARQGRGARRSRSSRRGTGQTAPSPVSGPRDGRTKKKAERRNVGAPPSGSRCETALYMCAADDPLSGDGRGARTSAGRPHPHAPRSRACPAGLADRRTRSRRSPGRQRATCRCAR